MQASFDLRRARTTIVVSTAVMRTPVMTTTMARPVWAVICDRLLRRVVPCLLALHRQLLGPSAAASVATLSQPVERRLGLATG